MKIFVLVVAFVSCASSMIAQEHYTAAVKKNSSLSNRYVDGLDTAAELILKNWFKPVEHPDKNFLNKEQATPFPAPAIHNMQHTILHYNKGTYCGHPRMVNFKYFPPNEIIVGHFHAPS